MRHWVQAVWTFVTNCYLVGFAEGRIYQGPLKNICFPGLNCYSCPGALNACPIGALQAVIGSWQYRFSLYVGGFLMIVGAVLGRFVCGWLCPFGMVQDFIFKIPFIRKIRHFPGDHVLRWLKYVILVVFVILLPLAVVDIVGQGTPTFCKYICPSGTLMAGLPLVSMNSGLRDAAGALFVWKLFVLIAVLLTALMIYRPFCKYLCPLGAIYALFNRVALYRLEVDEKRCTHCGLCSKVCRMGAEPENDCRMSECIRCGDCQRACPQSAIYMGVGRRVKLRQKAPGDNGAVSGHFPGGTSS